MIASLLFMGGLRRSEVSTLEWRDVADASDGGGVLITVRTSKTNQEGDTADVRYLKNGAAKAIRTVRAAGVTGNDPARLREGAGTSTSPHNNLTGGISRCGLGKVPAREYHSKTTAKLQHWGNISLTELKGETEVTHFQRVWSPSFDGLSPGASRGATVCSVSFIPSSSTFMVKSVICSTVRKTPR